MKYAVIIQVKDHVIRNVAMATKRFTQYSYADDEFDKCEQSYINSYYNYTNVKFVSYREVLLSFIN